MHMSPLAEAKIDAICYEPVLRSLYCQKENLGLAISAGGKIAEKNTIRHISQHAELLRRSMPLLTSIGADGTLSRDQPHYERWTRGDIPDKPPIEIPRTPRR